MLAIRPNPRLERWLRRLGLVFEVTAGEAALASDGARPLRITSPFPFHQVRQIMSEVGLSAQALRPADDEGLGWQRVLVALEGAPTIDGEGDFDEDAEVLDGLETALDLHQALELFLVRHRLALMRADVSQAVSTWSDFARRLRNHFRVEDRTVMPVYRAYPPDGSWARGAHPDIVDNEHQKIEAKLQAIETGLVALAKEEQNEHQRVRCLYWLDRQKVLQDVLEHHDLRERRFVYPHLAAVVETQQRVQISRALLEAH